jgi:uncharacterized protein (TIGR02611 family)
VADEERHPLLEKLHERRLRHQQRGLLTRAAVVVFGFLLVLLGIVLSAPGVPGPGIATILVGLAFLALEFDRAERWLERTILWAEAARERAERSSPRQRMMTVAAAFVVGIAVVAAMAAWDIPLLPV